MNTITCRHHCRSGFFISDPPFSQEQFGSGGWRFGLRCTVCSSSLFINQGNSSISLGKLTSRTGSLIGVRYIGYVRYSGSEIQGHEVNSCTIFHQWCNTPKLARDRGPCGVIVFEGPGSDELVVGPRRHHFRRVTNIHEWVEKCSGPLHRCTGMSAGRGVTWVLVPRL